MRSYVFLFITIAVLAGFTTIANAEKAQSLSDQFRHGVISRGNNYPSINVDHDQFDAIMVLLHRDKSIAEISTLLDLSESDIITRIEQLIDEGLIAGERAKGYRLLVPVVEIADAEKFFATSPEIIAETVALIERNLPKIKQKYATIEGLNTFPFEKLSLYILSNVLLDSPQINIVERDFLKANRPKRAGGNYYFRISELPSDRAGSPFGIYGNHFNIYGDVGVSLYGNRRYVGPPNLVTIGREDLVTHFGFAPSVSVKDGRETIARDIVHIARGHRDNVPKKRLDGLKWLGALDADENLTIPVLNTDTGEQGLSEIAEIIAPDLISLLEAQRTQLNKQFQQTPYAQDGVSFEEWFIWQYHHYYTHVTDRLIEKGLITPPPSGNTAVIFAEENS